MLKTRALSALALAPPALLATWAGGYAFAAMVALAAALMCWEWHRIALGGFGRAGQAAAAGCVAASILAVSHPAAAMAVVAAAAALMAVMAGRAGRAWATGGLLYVGLPSVALVWLRLDPVFGEAVVWWLLLMVWATDIGAYACGRLIGGPLLLPAVSPKKTWAGLLGGMASAALVGPPVAWAFGLSAPGAVMALGAVGAVVAQAGDLFESWVKRRWNVKDSSGIIPGHGGVLDRVDGLLSAALAVAVLTLAGGRSVLAW
ncbi:phosphatidate cytidylyltransferase [Magnetospirillum sp. SS-4]|uniref:phosphatidate cytidylyltransferase n=1 Tax=Magnetospirillum sp. SS-4 TaxID=2681465 RepID=UPI001574D320|nr:phosphatidate cytidylyltransferase [Magnetospirillum sp. SS-4]